LKFSFLCLHHRGRQIHAPLFYPNPTVPYTWFT